MTPGGPRWRSLRDSRRARVGCGSGLPPFRSSRLGAALASACLALAVAGCGGASPPPPRAGGSAKAAPQPCNGLAQLCAKRVDQVVFAATHNSMSASSEGFRFANQETGIAAQLAGGIRGLLIDTHEGVSTPKGVYTVLARGEKSREKIKGAIGSTAYAAAIAARAAIGYRGGGKPELYLCHGFCEIGASRAVDDFRAIRDFLNAHPGEVLLISVEDDTAPAALERAVAESGLLPLVWQGAVTPLPTLGEMVAGGRRVLFMAENDARGVAWLHPQFELAGETRFNFKKPAELLGDGGCAANRGGTAPPMLLINQFVDSFPPSARNAKVLNGLDTIVSHARRCMAERGRVPTLIAVDHWKVGDVVGAARELDEQLASSGG